MADPPAGLHAAVLGSPIAHSLSPALHLAAYAGLGLNWTYEAFDVTEATLPAFLATLDHAWAGLSLTMPLKESVIPLLGRIDDTAMAVRAVNTVLPDGDGWWGTNTDIFGMTESLRRAGVSGRPARATVLGAGATARSAVVALARMGVREVRVCARRIESAQEVVDLARRVGIDEAGAAGLEPDAGLVCADVVVSTLPGDAGSGWAIIADAAHGALLDASYHPWPTPLAAAWGSEVIASGRDMLLWQAVEQVRLMTGLEPSADLMAAALPA